MRNAFRQPFLVATAIFMAGLGTLGRMSPASAAEPVRVVPVRVADSQGKVFVADEALILNTPGIPVAYRKDLWIRVFRGTPETLQQAGIPVGDCFLYHSLLIRADGITDSLNFGRVLSEMWLGHDLGRLRTEKFFLRFEHLSSGNDKVRVEHFVIVGAQRTTYFIAGERQGYTFQVSPDDNLARAIQQNAVSLTPLVKKMEQVDADRGEELKKEATRKPDCRTMAVVVGSSALACADFTGLLNAL